MNVRLIGGPANGELLVVPDGTKEVFVPTLEHKEARWDFAPSPDDYPPRVETYCYSPLGLIGDLKPEHVVPFYLNGLTPP